MDMDGSGPAIKTDPVKHVQPTSTKTKIRALVCNVLTKPPLFHSLKTASAKVDFLGMEVAVWIVLLQTTLLGCVNAYLEHSGVKTLVNANLVLKTTSVKSSPPSARCVLSSPSLSLNLPNVLHVQKDSPGKATPALNVQTTMLETELLAVFVLKEHLRLKTRPSAKSLRRSEFLSIPP